MFFEGWIQVVLWRIHIEGRIRIRVVFPGLDLDIFEGRIRINSNKILSPGKKLINAITGQYGKSGQKEFLSHTLKKKIISLIFLYYMN